MLIFKIHKRGVLTVSILFSLIKMHIPRVRWSIPGPKALRSQWRCPRSLLAWFNMTSLGRLYQVKLSNLLQVRLHAHISLPPPPCLYRRALFVLTRVCMHVCMQTCVWGHDQSKGVIFQGPFIIFFGLSLSWSLLRKQGSQVLEPQGSPISASSILRLQAWTTSWCFFYFNVVST